MRRSTKPLILTILYAVIITAAITANQRGADPEGVILGQAMLSLPWGVIPVLVHVNAWYGPCVYFATIAFNAITVYMVAAWLMKRNRRHDSGPME
ncbi:MAG: hypothetical protein WBY44_08190 [Bryobacteraceae bacterium]|jgi:hypothetical protein